MYKAAQVRFGSQTPTLGLKVNIYLIVWHQLRVGKMMINCDWFKPSTNFLTEEGVNKMMINCDWFEHSISDLLTEECTMETMFGEPKELGSLSVSILR